MTRSRALNRFHRWTAKVRRRHLRSALPEEKLWHLPEPPKMKSGDELRRLAWQRDQLSQLEDPALVEEAFG
ncbi:hypothetical protein EVJ50_01705 [Synechococcus sp. RSCCF101]|uniref:hypothetical protein n=1 Tax=Synechococcus sp. RSCCF101 TaxID=2511069 RepID=UPI00124825A3|nr:hypothetical protein [Synechococcus sp. RSCCF101]QEY31154.1 hypothetical protein EVJ50_01705 [Synechococcus sp. RSCCF101]